jgi:hypothetical protein
MGQLLKKSGGHFSLYSFSVIFGSASVIGSVSRDFVNDSSSSMSLIILKVAVSNFVEKPRKYSPLNMHHSVNDADGKWKKCLNRRFFVFIF